MGRIKTTELDGTAQAVQQLAQPSATIAQHEEHAGTNHGLPQYHSDVGVVHDFVIGRPWATGFFDCQEDLKNAIMTAFFPCVTFGQIAEVLDGGEMTCPLGSFIYLLMMPALCSQWIMGSKYRAKLRKKIETTQLNGSAQAMPQLAPPAVTIIQPQVDDCSTNGFLQDQTVETTRGIVVNNLIVGRPWTTGLYDCHEHPVNAIMTAFFPCVTFGQISEILDEGQTTCPLRSLFYVLMMPIACSQLLFFGSRYRRKLRMKYDLVEAPYEDKISHIFCPFCSLCQEFRELKNMGLDPALGWNGILAREQARETKNQQVQVPPPNQAMVQ
ncbi:hypothetical protein L1049_003648 [Liquidambar formosana]|uniref:Protein PLANT CADMIUM RESISTANCE 8 n=1 Tax=Liquidambar formosana TaxID=63359 RepID=A0AAP0RRB7_LIQFO